MRASDIVLGPLRWMSQEDSALTSDLRLLSCDLRLRCKFVACPAAEMMSMTWCKDDASVAASEPSLFDGQWCGKGTSSTKGAAAKRGDGGPQDKCDDLR